MEPRFHRLNALMSSPPTEEGLARRLSDAYEQQVPADAKQRGEWAYFLMQKAPLTCWQIDMQSTEGMSLAFTAPTLAEGDKRLLELKEQGKISEGTCTVSYSPKPRREVGYSPPPTFRAAQPERRIAERILGLFCRAVYRSK